MSSSKEATNRKWTSTEQHRDNWDRIFGPKQTCVTCSNIRHPADFVTEPEFLSAFPEQEGVCVSCIEAGLSRNYSQAELSDDLLTFQGLLDTEPPPHQDGEGWVFDQETQEWLERELDYGKD